MSAWIYATKWKNPITKELEGQCQRCNKIKCSGNSATTLKNHLKSHGLCLDKATESIILTDERASEKRQKTAGNFHGWHFNSSHKQKYIHQSIARDGFKLPANESDIIKLLHKDCDEKQIK